MNDLKTGWGSGASRASVVHGRGSGYGLGTRVEKGVGPGVSEVRTGSVIERGSEREWCYDYGG